MTLPVAETNPVVVTFPPVTLPVAETNPVVVTFPPVILPVADTTPAVVMLPVADTTPAVVMLPPITLAVALSVVLLITLAPVMLPPDPVVEMLPPVILPVALTTPPVSKLPPVALPVTVKLVNEPTEVTLGCAAVANVPVILVPLRFPPVILPVADTTPPVNIFPPVALPVTVRLVNEPTEVTLGCAAVVNVPVINVPLRLPPVILPVADTIPPVNIFPPVALPVTVRLVNEPTEVILVCAAVVNVPVILVTLRLPPVMLPVADTIPPVSKLPVMVLPVTLKLASVPIDVAATPVN